MKQDVCFICCIVVGNRQMEREITYKNGVFEVKLVEAPETAVRQWEDVSCECQGYHQRSRHPMVRGQEEECRHIREAKLFHWLTGKISEVDETGVEDIENNKDERMEQEQLSRFDAAND